MQLGQKSNDVSEENGGEDEERLKDEPAADGERIVAAEVAALVDAVKVFEPRRDLAAEVPEAGEVVGKHGADRPGE